MKRNLDEVNEEEEQTGRTPTVLHLQRKKKRYSLVQTQARGHTVSTSLLTISEDRTVLNVGTFRREDNLRNILTCFRKMRASEEHEDSFMRTSAVVFQSNHSNRVAGLCPRSEVCEVRLSSRQHEQLGDSDHQSPTVELHHDRGKRAAPVLYPHLMLLSFCWFTSCQHANI